MRLAFDGGVRYFDTAPFYGYGRVELRVGESLRDLPRTSCVLSTKVGRTMRPIRSAPLDASHRLGGLPFIADYDYSYDGMMRSVEQSMIRLTERGRTTRDRCKLSQRLTNSILGSTCRHGIHPQRCPIDPQARGVFR